ncbi:MAG: ABC transporter permease [Pyrinomonadaceae bacterium]
MIGRLVARRFAGDPNVLGQQVILNGREFTIVGVAPANFSGAEAGRINDIFVPMMMQALVRPPRSGYSGEMNPDLLSVRGAGWLDMIGRLKPGVTVEQAQNGMNTLAAQLERAYPDTNREQTAALFPVSKGDPEQRTALVSIAALLMAVVGLVLLIACANVANLLLARATSRRKEISIRLAMGAGRTRLVRQLLTESVLLSLLGGAVGVLLAVWMIDALQAYSLSASLFPFTFDFGLDKTVLGFALGLSVLTGIFFGIAPALQASNPDLVHALKDEAVTLAGKDSRRFNLRNLLVVAQVALSLVLLIGAGLFLRSLRHAQSIDPGFEPERVLVMPLNINMLRYTRQQGKDFYERVIERVEALPGVQSATLSRNPPLSGASRQSSVLIEGQDAAAANSSSSEGQVSAPDANQNLTLADVVDLKYFATLGMPLLSGRDFAAQDRENSPGVVVINEMFARRYFPDQDPIGRRLSLSGTRGPWLEVIGTVRDAKYLTSGTAHSVRLPTFAPTS